MPDPDYSDFSDFRTLRIRVNPDKSAVLEPPFRVNAGESLKVIVSGAAGADVGTLLLSLHAKESPYTALVTPPAAWYAVPAEPGAFYASLDMATDAVDTLLADTGPGDEVVVRLYVADSGNVWADCDLPLTPAPYRDADTWPAPQPAFLTAASGVTKESLAAGVAAVKALPTLTAAQREARVQALLDLLDAATA